MSKEHNCPNCGAPIHDLFCPYCGTVIYDFVNMEAGKPTYLRVRYMGHIITCKAYVHNVEITSEADMGFLIGGYPVSSHMVEVEFMIANGSVKIIEDKENEP